MLLKHLFKTIPVLLLLVLMGSSCDVKPTVMGYQHRIFVVADSMLWNEIKDDFEATFEPVIHTPHTENKFFVTRIGLDQLNEFNTRMNLFFLGVARGGDDVSTYITKILPAEYKQGVSDQNYFYLFSPDMFARDQIGVIMYANDRASFKRNFDTYKKEIYERFEKKYYARLKKSMFEKDEQKDLAAYLRDNYGFEVRVQHDYMMAAQNIEDRYVWLRRFDPDRWVSIWPLSADSTVVNFDSLVAIRNRMTKTWYEGDVVVEDETGFDQVDFRGEPTAKLTGTWKNDSLAVGGPFRMYAVYEPQDSLMYFIDIAVMAPGKLKKPYLDQLEVIASTFRLNEQAD